MKTSIDIGHLHLDAEPRGAHIVVHVRGSGAVGSRPLLGTLVMRASEWTSLELVAELTTAVAPLQAVLGSWDWQGIAADGCFRTCYEPAIESVVRAMAEAEKRLQSWKLIAPAESSRG